MVLLISPNLEKELTEVSKAAGRKFARDKIYEIAQEYYKRMPKVKELWILIVGKTDLMTGKLNVLIRAADKANKHKIDLPIQGSQLWYTNQTTGEIRPEWILPFSAKKRPDDLFGVTKGNKIIEASFIKAEEKLGRDLLTGRVKNYRHRRPFGV